MGSVNTHGRRWSVRGRSVGRGHQKTDSPQIIKSSVAHLGDNSPGPVEWVLHETLLLCRAASFDADSLSDSLKSYHSVFSTHTCLFTAFTRSSSTDLDRNYCCPLGSWDCELIISFQDVQPLIFVTVSDNDQKQLALRERNFIKR